MNKKSIRFITLLSMLAITIFISTSVYAGSNTVFGVHFNLEANSGAFWPVYPNYETFVSSETWYPTPNDDIYVDQIQAVGDVFIDDVFITRIDQFDFDSSFAYADTAGRQSGQKILIDCYHYAHYSAYNETLSTYTNDYEYR